MIVCLNVSLRSASSTRSLPPVPLLSHVIAEGFLAGVPAYVCPSSNTVEGGACDASDYPNFKDFNAIARELNRLAEAEIERSQVKKVAAGSRVEFVGCVEVRSEPGDVLPLKVIPISVTVGHAVEPSAKAAP